MTPELRAAMKRHRIARTVTCSYQREMAKPDSPVLLGQWLDSAHLDHWHALQRAGIPASRAGQLCAAITRTRLPR